MPLGNREGQSVAGNCNARARIPASDDCRWRRVSPSAGRSPCAAGLNGFVGGTAVFTDSYEIGYVAHIYRILPTTASSVRFPLASFRCARTCQRRLDARARFFSPFFKDASGNAALEVQPALLSGFPGKTVGVLAEGPVVRARFACEKVA